MLRNKKAQSTLEYIAVFAAIVAAVVSLAYSKIKPGVQNVLEASATYMGTQANQLNPTQ